MAELKIVCPSHDRAETLSTHKAVAGIVVVVEESQKGAYLDANPGLEIETHPDSLRGIAAKRQWMYERWGDLFMLDDDISSVVFLGTESGKPEKVDPGSVRDRIIGLHDEAVSLGIVLYGFGVLPNPMYYEPQSPYKLAGNISGGAFGMRPSPHLYFHPGLVVFDDMWISALNAYYHRVILKDMRYQLVTAPMNVTPGGMAHERNTRTTAASRELLDLHFGTAVRNSKVSEALLHLEIPW
jgi:hypothetical protein